jgi:hypothetical protein
MYSKVAFGVQHAGDLHDDFNLVGDGGNVAPHRFRYLAKKYLEEMSGKHTFFL